MKDTDPNYVPFTLALAVGAVLLTAAVTVAMVGILSSLVTAAVSA